ncbi:hypothetical protein BV898_11416 [Hypsibius exemplaris]|uniref:Uncharacterized protein n=1 Tax=Hypsibius exemplaris TaxID=2072580 RepID=A0A1W0WGW1_HYPEX|nr:hypothetical protein BV898_11416 [Hypsibius exemplaris]
MESGHQEFLHPLRNNPGKKDELEDMKRPSQSLPQTKKIQVLMAAVKRQDATQEAKGDPGDRLKRWPPQDSLASCETPSTTTEQAPHT